MGGVSGWSVTPVTPVTRSHNEIISRLLSVVKTQHSLTHISTTLTSTIMNRLDSAGYSSSNLSQLDESYTSTEDWQEDFGTTLDLELPDGRLNSRADVSRVMVTVSPLDQELRDNFKVRLATNHYSFTLGRSVTIRAFTAFLYLEVRPDIDP